MTKSPTSAPAPPRDVLSPEMEELFEAISKLKTASETAAFLRDLCTIAELRAMSGRWQVALLLDQGLHYLEIAKRTGASTATITRVSNWLRFGSGGYRSMLDRRQRSRAR
ncbi:MAG TPA: YerC/YecD family TrpR-related protein [Candidatus Acidoferrales bacterium]|nr:YerC/YecD family TrpR-related protein [Candidatus Acidoferrales bacterium]